MDTKNTDKTPQQQEYEKALEFAQMYYNSDGFNERFENAKSEYLPKGFVLNKKDFKTPTLQITDKPNAYYSPKGDKILYTTDTNVLQHHPLFHEFGHKIDYSIHLDKKNFPNWLFRKTPFRYGYSSIYPVFYRNQNLQNSNQKIKEGPLQDRKQNKIEHDGQPQESYGDLMNLRYHLYNSGIYDSTKANNPFTQDHIDKLKEQFDFTLPENHGISRLFQNFDEKDIIEMMNTVAQNKYNDDNQPIYAKKGTKLIPKFYEPWNPFKRQSERSNKLPQVPTEFDRKARENQALYKHFGSGQWQKSPKGTVYRVTKDGSMQVKLDDGRIITKICLLKQAITERASVIAEIEELEKKINESKSNYNIV